jgi:hypothetical protein
MVLLRRWYVTLPALIISLGLAAAVFGSVPAKYASKGTIVLLSPGASRSDTGQSSPTNPLLSFDGSLTTVSTALIQEPRPARRHGRLPGRRRQPGRPVHPRGGHRRLAG